MSWISVPQGSPFSIRNVPFGIVSYGDKLKRPAVIIGETVLDLKEFSDAGGFEQLRVDGFSTKVFDGETLNMFAQLGKPVYTAVWHYLRQVLSENGPFSSVLEKNHTTRAAALVEVSNVQNHLPFAIGDYTDFYVGRNHAYNCGVLFRGPQNALQPNYEHLPVGYHGRASSVVVSGTPIVRPVGQILTNPGGSPPHPVLAPTQKLDYELEVAAFVSTPTKLGESVPIERARDHIFGYVLMNDWSARDIQSWEYVPLGPFTAKNFGTSISPWVVLDDALAPFRTGAMQSSTQLLPYLQELDPNSVFDIELEIGLTTADGHSATVSQSNSKFMLFSFQQMLTHHTITGCNINTGDLLGSGTLSSESRQGLGSLLELSAGGKQQVSIGTGAKHAVRTFLEDGDTVTFRAIANDGSPHLVGFGSVTGSIVPPTYRRVG